MGVGELSDYEQKLLAGWEDVHKKGQLTLWIFLGLKESPKHMSEIKAFVELATKGTMSADDQSMYRALRRYNENELIEYTTEPGEGGPERKIYRLTKTGEHVLEAFLGRNIINTFYDPAIKKIIQ